MYVHMNIRTHTSLCVYIPIAIHAHTSIGWRSPAWCTLVHPSLSSLIQGVATVASVSLAISYPTVVSVPHSIANGFKVGLPGCALF